MNRVGRLRIDPADLARWMKETSAPRLVAWKIMDSWLLVWSVLFYTCARCSIVLLNLIAEQVLDVARWSGFVPAVLEEKDFPGSFYIDTTKRSPPPPSSPTDAELLNRVNEKNPTDPP